MPELLSEYSWHTQIPVENVKDSRVDCASRSNITWQSRKAESEKGMHIGQDGEYDVVEF